MSPALRLNDCVKVGPAESRNTSSYDVSHRLNHVDCSRLLTLLTDRSTLSNDSTNEGK